MINVYTFSPTDCFGSNCYLVSVNGEYAVVDPSVDLKTLMARHPEIDGRIKFILITHAHFDHILRINSYTEQCKNVIVGADDGAALSDAYLNCYLGFMGVTDGYFGEYQGVNDGELLELGGEKIRVIATPGHTKGGVSYRIGNYIFSGDTVFDEGGYGRCDLPGGDIDTLEKSIIRLLTHENEAVFYPGHGSCVSLRELVKYFS